MDVALLKTIALAAGLAVEQHPTTVPKVIGFAKLDAERRWLYGIPAADFERVVAAVAQHCIELSRRVEEEEGEHETMLAAGAGAVAYRIREAFGLPQPVQEPRAEWVASQEVYRDGPPKGGEPPLAELRRRPSGR